MVYDKDDDVFCQLRQYHREFSSSSSESSPDSENIIEMTGRTRSLSLTVPAARVNTVFHPVRRTNSCPLSGENALISSDLPDCTSDLSDDAHVVKEAPN